jgi:hypothetical protein
LGSDRYDRMTDSQRFWSLVCLLFDGELDAVPKDTCVDLEIAFGTSLLIMPDFLFNSCECDGFGGSESLSIVVRRGPGLVRAEVSVTAME